jgi:hypothetical protein
MLAESAESPEMHAAESGRANVDLLLVTRASEMLIEGDKGMKHPVAKVALKHASVPSRTSGIILYVLINVSIGDETGRVGDDVVLVVFQNITLDGVTVDFGATAT